MFYSTYHNILTFVTKSKLVDVVYSKYNYDRSRGRIDTILDNLNTKFIEDEEQDPLKSMLTFNDAKKLLVDVLVVDIRDSTTLSELLTIVRKEINITQEEENKKEKERVSILKKIYGAYISEVIAVLKGNKYIKKIYIEGDGIWATFESNHNRNTHLVFASAVRVSSIVETINSKLRDKDYPHIEIGIGIETGVSYYIKGGYKNSGINEEVWIGNVVNKAFKFCSYANKKPIKEIVVSSNVYNSLRSDQKKQLKYNKKMDIYHTELLDKEMYDEWLSTNPSSFLSCSKKNYCYYKIEDKKTSNFSMFILIGMLIFVGYWLMYNS